MYAEVPSQLANVDRPAVIGCARTARGDGKPRKAGQCRCDLFGQAIDEAILRQALRQACEAKHGDTDAARAGRYGRLSLRRLGVARLRHGGDELKSASRDRADHALLTAAVADCVACC
jgi:hypothetical protein